MQLYEDVFLNAPMGIYTLDKDGTITSFNPKMAELAGDDPNEVVGLNVFEMDSYKKSGLDAFFAKGLAGESFETEVDYISLLGHKKSTRHYRGVPLQGHDKPGAARLLLLVEDVTERRAAERRLELERRRLAALINSLADGVIALNEKQEVIIFNGATLGVLDVNEDLSGRQVSDILNITDKTNKPVNISERIKNVKAPVVYDDWLLHYPDGESINLYVSISPVYQGYHQEGERGHVLLLRDITQEKTLEAQRDEFISVVSHELRTPLTTAEAALSTAMVMADRQQAEKAIGLLKEAHKNVTFLADLVNDISTLALAERGAMDIEPEEVDVQALLKELEGECAPKAEAAGLAFHLEVPSDVPHIVSNHYRLKEVLGNILNNALKYTEEGSITLKAEQLDGTRVRFSIIDTGIGIKKSDQKHIFERFWRSEDYRTRTHSGTGLGLYLAKRVTERLQGTIDFESKVGEGTAFTVTVPMKLTERKNAIPAEAEVQQVY